MIKFSIIIIISILLASCNNTIQVGEDTFVHDEKVYRIIDSEVTELGNLKTDVFTKSEVLNPTLRDFGRNEMNFVKTGVYTNLNAVYRGDILYFKLELHELNDLRYKYRNGGLTINFIDEYGFNLHATTVGMLEMIRIIGANNETSHFEFNGKSQMSSEVYSSIVTYSVSSSLQ